MRAVADVSSVCAPDTTTEKLIKQSENALIITAPADCSHSRSCASHPAGESRRRYDPTRLRETGYAPADRRSGCPRRPRRGQQTAVEVQRAPVPRYFAVRPGNMLLDKRCTPQPRGESLSSYSCDSYLCAPRHLLRTRAYKDACRRTVVF